MGQKKKKRKKKNFINLQARVYKKISKSKKVVRKISFGCLPTKKVPHKSANGLAKRKGGFENKRLHCLSLQNRCHEVLVKQNTLVAHGPSTTNYQAWWCHMPCQFFIHFAGPPKILKHVWLMAWLHHKKPNGGRGL